MFPPGADHVIDLVNVANRCNDHLMAATRRQRKCAQRCAVDVVDVL